MDYLKGYTIKPYTVEPNGEVIFTDGTNNDIRANQTQCQAYGFTYDPNSGTCKAFDFNLQMNTNFQNIDNKIYGPGNITGTGVNNTIINGTNNIVEGNSNNGFISGRNNKIDSGVDNATVVGVSGTAIRQGEFVVGSNAGQTSSFALNGTTTDATATALFVDGDSSVTTIARENDFPYFFTIDAFGFRTGGASGSGAVGDATFIKIEGFISDVTLTQTTATVVNKGTSATWRCAPALSGSNLQLKATGQASMDITWQANATFTKMIGT
jgi:hypothetical protein